MTTLVTGSAGHLGEALMRKLRAQAGAGDRLPVGLDIKASPYTTVQGSINDAASVAHAMKGVTESFTPPRCINPTSQRTVIKISLTPISAAL